MPKLNLYSLDGKNAGTIEANELIFGKAMNEAIVHSAVNWYLASLRQGTHSTLTRSEVSGGGKKPWRQKGTGRARAGSIRSPLWRKGGVVFGPKPRDYSYSMPIKMRKLALIVALSDKVREEKLKVVEELKIPEMKTKLAVKLMKDMGISGKILFVPVKDDSNFWKAARNIEGVKLSRPETLNIFDLVLAEWVVMEKGAIEKIEGRLKNAA